MVLSDIFITIFKHIVQCLIQGFHKHNRFNTIHKICKIAHCTKELAYKESENTQRYTRLQIKYKRYTQTIEVSTFDSLGEYISLFIPTTSKAHIVQNL